MLDPCLGASAATVQVGEQVARKLFKLATRCCNASRMDKRPAAVSMQGRMGETITQQLQVAL